MTRDGLVLARVASMERAGRVVLAGAAAGVEAQLLRVMVLDDLRRDGRPAGPAPALKEQAACQRATGRRRPLGP